MKKYFKVSKTVLEWSAVFLLVSLAIPTVFFWFFGYEKLSFWTLFISVPVGTLISIIIVSAILFGSFLFKRDDD